MKSLLSIPLTADRLWEFSCVLTGWYLLFHPCLGDPKSFAVALGGGLVLLLFRPIQTGAFARMGRLWMVFLLYLLFSSFWSLIPGLTLQSAGFVFLGTLLYLMASANDPQTQSRLEVLGILGASAAAGWALHQRLYGFDNLALTLPQLSGEELKIATAGAFNKRAFGPLVTPGALAGLMILFIPQGFIRAKISSGLRRLVYSALTILLALGLWATGSVGALACLAVSVLVVLGYRRLWRWLIPALFLGLLLVALAVQQRGLHSWLLAAFSMRLKLWASALSLFSPHPWFGSGLGTFGEAYQRSGLDLNTGAQYTHNILIQLLVETGLLGTALFLSASGSLLLRFQKPFRWEAWGVLPGVLAFAFFGLIDLPFQMSELVWLFALVAGRLALKPEKELRVPMIPARGLEWGVLAVLLVSGFWPPFRPWDFALLACVLWAAYAYLQAKVEKVPLWVFAGAFYLASRAFVSPSALGSVRFLETAGLALVFVLLARRWTDPRKFLVLFCGLGIFWALRVWLFSFQFSDIKYWRIFPNPKQVGIFLIPLLFLLLAKPLDFKSLSLKFLKDKKGLGKAAVFVFSLAAIICLKAFSAMVGLVAGLVVLVKKEQRLLVTGAAVVLVALIMVYRVMAFHSLEKNSSRWDRIHIWGSAVQVWERKPWVGVGPGAFAGYFHQVKSPRPSGINRYLMDAEFAHSEYLEFLTAFGLTGFLWAAAFLFYLGPFKCEGGKRSALAALGTASLFDFCLHTPLLALQGAALAAPDEKRDAEHSMAGGLLALGLALGLFGSAAFVPALQEKSLSLRQNKDFPQALRCAETAGLLNAWDARVQAFQADYLEELFLATRDPVWKRKADEAYAKVLDLEKADGQWNLKNAERLSSGFFAVPSAEDAPRVKKAWEDAKQALPLNAFVYEEEGIFLLKTSERQAALLDFKKAVELEPNLAMGWVRLGSLFKETGDKSGAKQAYAQALEVFRQWKDADRVDPVEKEMVNLPPPVLEFLGKETAR